MMTLMIFFISLTAVGVAMVFTAYQMQSAQIHDAELQAEVERLRTELACRDADGGGKGSSEKASDSQSSPPV